MPRNLFQPLEIVTFDTKHLHCPLKNNTYFELVFVQSGSGYRVVDDHRLAFVKNNLFLHLPNEANAIKLRERSVLHFIKFQRVLFEDADEKTDDLSFKGWFRRIEFILFSGQSKATDLIDSPDDRKLIGGLVNLLVQEATARKLCFDQNLKATLHILLNIIARNVLQKSLKHKPDAANGEPDKDIITYINYHIFDAGAISLPNLADVFSIAPTYFSEYFKKKYGIPLKRYILEYKVKLVESRLNHTNMSLSEIASELNFTDTSHLNRIFRKYRGVNPRHLKNADSNAVL